jgi:hypothetical protein
MAEYSDAGDGEDYDENRGQERVPTASPTTWRPVMQVSE